MKFVQRITALQKPEWKGYYLDYVGLKQLLTDLEAPMQALQSSAMSSSTTNTGTTGTGTATGAALNGDDSNTAVGGNTASSFAASIRQSLRGMNLIHVVQRSGSRSDLPSMGGGANHDVPPTSAIFLNALNMQVKKIVLFVLSTQGSIAGRLVECEQEQGAIPDDARPERFRALRDRYNAIGGELLHLIQFVDMNVKAIERILKKHDKYLGYGHRYRAYDLYFGGSNKRSSDMMQPLLHEEPLAALCVTLESALSDLRIQQEQCTGMSAGKLGESTGISRSSSEPQFIPLNTEHRTFSEWHRESSDHPSGYAGSAVSAGGRAHRHYHADDVILAHIYAARRRMKQSGEFVQLLAASSWVNPGISVSESARGFSAGGKPTNESKIQAEYEQASKIAEYQTSAHYSAMLNLASGFIYMANYLIVVPTVTTYAEKLGAPLNLSSAIVGMMPLATIFSTVVYSWWTSYSYRQPMICATVMNMAGNFVYAMGYPCNSMAFVLVGRLMSGFGSCRPINRRYIADAFSTAERTAASATFVGFSVFGMAVGPFIGSVLHRVAENSKSPYWQVENAPGWFMCATWSVYLVFLLVFFVDPPKEEDETKDEPSVADTASTNGSAGVPTSNGDEGADGETQPLLLKSSSFMSDREEIPVWRNPAVLVNFFIYFFEKLVMECVSSSTSILTYYYFEWPGSYAGMYLAFLCLIILPVNMLVAYLSKKYEDRELMWWMQAATIVGCVVILRFGETYTIEQYIVGSTIIVVFSNMVEGPNMSLLSKTLPKSWRKGFLNVGLLATEAATLGRTVGDAYLALCGADGLEKQLNYTFGGMVITALFTMYIMWRYYDSLVPTEDKGI